MHFAMCPTNPTVIQNRWEHNEDTLHRRQLEQQEQEKNAMLNKANVFNSATTSDGKSSPLSLSCLATTL